MGSGFTRVSHTRLRRWENSAGWLPNRHRSGRRPGGKREYGRACMQTNPAIANLAAPSEDCLFVNVWTPARRARERLPVMVWIHGGGFAARTPAEQLYRWAQSACSARLF